MQVVCHEPVYGKAKGEEAACDNAVSGEVVSGEVVSGEVVSGEVVCDEADEILWEEVV